MARATGLLENIEGQLESLTFYKKNGKTFVRPRHIDQPRRLSRKQLLVRERQSHNNALWRALKRTKMVFFAGDKAPYNSFMSLNMFSPVPYLQRLQYQSDNALLLPEMVLSDGPLPPISYQLGEVDGRPALLTDLTRAAASKERLLLYVLEQQIIPWHRDEDLFRLNIEVETLTADDFVNVPSTLLSPYKNVHGTLALVGDRFADPMLGFGLVRVEEGRASSQRVVTRCTYYERFTTEEALQAAAKSYGGLTGEF
ncbi:MAG: hypothetical protein J6X88_10540 [Bacteroidales bacterium]|nr:hypothetical protein [Bacteroidales bacterium]